MDIKKKNLENRSVQKSLQLLTEEKDRLRHSVSKAAIEKTKWV